MKISPLQNFILCVALAIFIILTAQIIFQSDPGWALNFTVAKDYASTVGGLLSFISVLFIYTTLIHQSKSFNKTQFENRFFAMVKLHRDNISALKMRDPNSEGKEYFEGAKVAREIHKQVLLVMELIASCFEGKTLDEIHLNTPYKELDYTNLTRASFKLDQITLTKINIAYLCVFFGLGKEGKHTLEIIFKSKYNLALFEEIIKILEEVKAVWDKNNPNFVKYFGGHQYRLGHVFRHLFQTVTYVNENEDLSFSQKYEYIKILRAQLSSYEQSLVFFNSLSTLGRAWELNVDISHTLSDEIKGDKLMIYTINRMLITKYNFIRNIPNEYIIPIIKISDFYPDLEFDGINKSKERITLEKFYNKQAYSPKS